MFEQIFSQGKKLFIPYLTAGVPSLDATERLAGALIEEGAMILELGVPYSDPSADGAILQRAADLALKNDVTLLKVLELSKKIHTSYPQVQIVLFTYFNPLLALGLKNYVTLAKDSGVAATLTVDLPVEEAGEYIQLHREANLKTVFLASPTTGARRLKLIDEASTAFVYYVSRTGVTGEQIGISETLESEVKALRQVVKGPLAIGFGISTPAQAAAVSRVADAVVIGSTFMRTILDQEDESCETAVRNLARGCMEKMNFEHLL